MNKNVCANKNSIENYDTISWHTALFLTLPTGAYKQRESEWDREEPNKPMWWWTKERFIKAEKWICSALFAIAAVPLPFVFDEFKTRMNSKTYLWNSFVITFQIKNKTIKLSRHSQKLFFSVNFHWISFCEVIYFGCYWNNCLAKKALKKSCKLLDFFHRKVGISWNRTTNNWCWRTQEEKHLFCDFIVICIGNNLWLLY